MDRRQFLKAGGVIAGGLVIGVSMAEPARADGVPSGGAISTPLAGTVGATGHDLDPRSSVLTAPAPGGFLLDQDYRSIGLDLGQPTAVNAVQLVTDTSAHRLNPRDLAVYTSADNKTWTKQRTEFLDLGTTVWLYGLDVQTRYIKVHCYRDGTAADATFGNADPQKLITAYTVPSGAFVAGTGAWKYQVPIKITNPAGKPLTDRAAYISHEALGTAALISAGKLRGDLADLRFADPQGRQLHAYDDGNGVFVRIPSVKANGVTPIFAHIGNPQAESVLADAGALQVEYGHRSYQPVSGTSATGLTLGGEVHPFTLPDGTLVMTAGAGASAAIRGAYIEADTNPATGNFTSYTSTTGKVAFDYNHRSIGLSFGAPRDVSSLVLTGLAANATGGTTTRLQPSDLGVWISNTNNSDWKQVSGWSGTKDGLTITLSGPTFNAAYVKVTQPYGDKAFTFANTIPPLLALPATSQQRAGGILAQYSKDGGRTWSAPEQLIPASDTTKGSDRAGGYLVDPVTGDITAVLYSVGVSSGADWTDPAQHYTQIWVARATSYDQEGRPQFGAPQHQPVTNLATGKPAAWALTYTNPIRTKSGAYVVSVPHIFTPDGQFALAVLRSTDQGRTWTQSQSMLTSSGNGVGLEAGVSESTVTQLPSGRLMIIVRNEELTEYYFGVSYSDDDGVTWTTPVADSRILATNTSPDFLARESGLLLSWSGHNGFGQTAYYRNNLTIAYSTDDGKQFEKYHDMTGATSVATPGWNSTAEHRMLQEAFITPSGKDDLVLGWQFGGGATGSTILIEDIDEYLHNSHGALDVIRYANGAGAANGTELSQSRWWRTAAPGKVTISDGAQAGRSAVRLTTAAGEKATGISRLFPGSRQARVRFQLRWDALGGTGAFFALQEAFAVTGNAHGAIALFQLGSDGTVLVASDDVYDLESKGGYLEADSNPAVGNLAWSGGAVALDYNKRSIGLFLGGKRDVSRLVLVGSSEYGSGGNSTRLQPSDLGVWISDTNNSDWTQVSGWGGTKDGLTITLTGPTFTSTYVKITQPYSDKSFTFANTIPPLVSPVPDLQQAQTFRPLQTPTRLAAQQWHQVQLDVDLDANRVVTAIDGTTVSQLGSVHPAQVLTHFLALAGDGGGADLRIAEFIVQDTSQGLPQLGKVNG